MNESEAPEGRSRPARALGRLGFWTVVVLGVYFMLISAIIAFERDTMLGAVTRLQEVHEREERLVALNVAVSRTILAINENYFSPDVNEAAKVVILEVEAILPGLRRLQAAYPMLEGDLQALRQSIDELATAPSRGTIAELRSVVHRLVIELDVITADTHSQKQRTVERYQSTFNRVTMEWLLFGVVGFAILGGLIMVFFRRLAHDIDRVRERAVAIVRGYRDDPLEHQRQDELGALMDAVNQMQQELRQRESEIELSRQQQFHKEKMAAVGSLAAAVAHEINNPLSAIVGVAQAMDQQCQVEQCSHYGEDCHPSMILDQAKRVMQITRRISEFSVPQSQEPELLDLNGLLRSTCNFVAFDRRFRLLELKTDLDSNLPAVCAIADHVVQVAMNLLINAADALQDRTEPPPCIAVRTRQEGGNVVVEVADNGTGIEPEHIDLVFREHFSTKGPGRGSGLGLAVCRSLIREAGGDITIASVWGEGTTVTVKLPLPFMGSESAAEAAERT